MLTTWKHVPPRRDNKGLSFNIEMMRKCLRRSIRTRSARSVREPVSTRLITRTRYVNLHVKHESGESDNGPLNSAKSFCISVSDSGSGFPPVSRHIFEAFHQAEKHNRRYGAPAWLTTAGELSSSLEEIRLETRKTRSTFLYFSGCIHAGPRERPAPETQSDSTEFLVHDRLLTPAALTDFSVADDRATSSGEKCVLIIEDDRFRAMAFILRPRKSLNRLLLRVGRPCRAGARI